MSDNAAGATQLPADRLLTLEQSEFERFLHDELGQCLVAVRSMAAALDDESSSDIADVIAQAADDSYVEVYDRMMELRAESLAHEPEFERALRQCLDDARLEARDLAYRLRLDDDIESITDPVCRRLLLRCLRGLALVLKRVADGAGELDIAIDRDGGDWSVSLRLQPAGFPETFVRHPRVARLEQRLAEFGGAITLDESTGVLRLRLPCDCGEVA